MTSETVIQSYVHCFGKCFFVSTIERDSSAMLGPERYNETMVWEYDYEKRERGAILFQDGCLNGSIILHQNVVNRIFETGTPDEPEEQH